MLLETKTETKAKRK